MHALSLPTWWIHIASVLEWVLAMLAVQQLGLRRREKGWRWLALAMLPALVSAMCACTWHLFDNPDAESDGDNQAPLQPPPASGGQAQPVPLPLPLPLPSPQPKAAPGQPPLPEQYTIPNTGG